MPSPSEVWRFPTIVPWFSMLVVVVGPVSRLMPEPSRPVMVPALKTVIGWVPVMPWRAPVMVPPAKLLTVPLLPWKSMPSLPVEVGVPLFATMVP